MQFISELIISEKEFYLTILVVVLVLIIYQVIANFFMIEASKRKNSNTKSILFTRLTGFILFSIVPLIFVFLVSENNINVYGIQLNSIYRSLMWIVPLLPILILASYFNSKQKGNLSVYPQVRQLIWTRQLLFISMSAWVLYLLAYEFLFRGFLLLVSISFLGIWSAILLNIVIYSLAHIPKGIKETVMAIPFGLVLSYSVIHTGNIWVAVILHSVLALSNEWFSLKEHPEMQLVKRK